MCKAARLFLLLFLCAAFPAAAQTTSWEQDKKTIHALMKEQPLNCARLWDTAWPWFKKGEVEAIQGLMMGPAGWGVMLLPLSVAQYQNRAEQYAMNVYWQLAQAGMLRSSLAPKIADISLKTADEYLACTQTHTELDCAETAAAQGDVPRFDDFVSVIEGRVDAGHKAMCKD